LGRSNFFYYKQKIIETKNKSHRIKKLIEFL
jgi:hypothetical protein